LACRSKFANRLKKRIFGNKKNGNLLVSSFIKSFEGVILSSNSYPPFSSQFELTLTLTVTSTSGFEKIVIFSVLPKTTEKRSKNNIFSFFFNLVPK